jgi:hypothetical protein
MICQAVLFVVLVGGQNLNLYSDMSSTCPHQYFPTAGAWVNLTASGQILTQIANNNTHNYYFENYKYFDSSRKIIVRLDPCQGVVYLFIRKTRPCWPNPWSEEWTHYKSITDGSEDGAATMFELPSETTQWYITVYAKTSSQYSLTILRDADDYPRLTDEAIIASQIDHNTVEIRWTPSTSPSATKYIIYSSMYFETGDRVNPRLLISPSRIMNTVCGLSINTDHPYSVVECVSSPCISNITSLINGRKYVFNVVAQDSSSGMHAAYSGILVQAEWDESVLKNADEILKTIGILIGTVVTVLVATFFVIYNKYSCWRKFCMYYSKN